MPIPKILVIDDQPINVQLLKRKLERENLEVIAASNGMDGLKMIARVKPDLVLLDVMMPDMNGIEVCQQLQASEETRAIPVIFITASTTKESKLEGLGVGAVDYITKPIRAMWHARRQHKHRSQTSRLGLYQTPWPAPPVSVCRQRRPVQRTTPPFPKTMSAIWGTRTVLCWVAVFRCAIFQKRALLENSFCRQRIRTGLRPSCSTWEPKQPEYHCSFLLSPGTVGHFRNRPERAGSHGNGWWARQDF